VTARVHQRAVDGPATHAIVIGVGDYPHLAGGQGALSPHHDGMGQLTSPPVSARRIAHWLIDKLDDPAKPLASVALLLSERRRRPFRNPATRVETAVQPATIDNVDAALNEWRAAGDESPDNRLLFFFSGHGIAQGPDTALLLADFGARRHNALDGAIDFGEFHLAMDTCAARQQCYFVDACRASSDTLIETLRYKGRPIFQADVRQPRPAGPREAPTYYSTLAGEDAYGRAKKPSPFTEALLHSLDGAGADDSEGDWRVSTTRLKEAIDYEMKRVVDAGGRRIQVPATNDLTTFFLHHVAGTPKATVFVGCRPEQAAEDADLTCVSGGRIRARREPAPGEWEVRLPAGTYEFVAESRSGGFQRRSLGAYVRPIYRRIPLDVTP
jgi:hypothetical protein